MSIGKGIAIAGIWVGVGTGLAFGNVPSAAAEGLAMAASFATIITAVFGW